MVTLVVIMMATSDPNSLVLSALGSPPEILACEVEWLNDPNILPTLFEEYEEAFGEPYYWLIVRNWLRTDRWCWDPREIDGVTYVPWKLPRSWIGDLNCDGRVDLHDFGKYAAGYGK